VSDEVDLGRLGNRREELGGQTGGVGDRPVDDRGKLVATQPER